MTHACSLADGPDAFIHGTSRPSGRRDQGGCPASTPLRASSAVQPRAQTASYKHGSGLLLISSSSGHGRRRSSDPPRLYPRDPAGSPHPRPWIMWRPPLHRRRAPTPTPTPLSSPSVDEEACNAVCIAVCGEWRCSAVFRLIPWMRARGVDGGTNT